MIQRVLDQSGSDFFIGIYGPAGEVEQDFNNAFNFGVTSGELHWLNDGKNSNGKTFAYYGTSLADIQRGFRNLFASELCREVGRTEPTVAINKEAKKMVNSLLNSIKREGFINHLRAPLFAH